GRAARSGGGPPADTEALLTVLERLKAAGNSVFVVEHHLEVVRGADWVVDVGPGAGEHGGRVLYSGPPAELASVEGGGPGGVGGPAPHRRRLLLARPPCPPAEAVPPPWQPPSAPRPPASGHPPPDDRAG
ncbi:hypothetical protein ACWGKX_33280, partial [Streptomyces tricolor]